MAEEGKTSAIEESKCKAVIEEGKTAYVATENRAGKTKTSGGTKISGGTTPSGGKGGKSSSGSIMFIATYEPADVIFMLISAAISGACIWLFFNFENVFIPNANSTLFAVLFWVFPLVYIFMIPVFEGFAELNLEDAKGINLWLFTTMAGGFTCNVLRFAFVNISNTFLLWLYFSGIVLYAIAILFFLGDTLSRQSSALFRFVVIAFLFILVAGAIFSVMYRKEGIEVIHGLYYKLTVAPVFVLGGVSVIAIIIEFFSDFI